MKPYWSEQAEIEKGIDAELKGNCPGKDSKERKAGNSGIAAKCPNCGIWHEVDEYGVRKHMLRNKLTQVAWHGYLPCRRWMTNVWGMNLNPATYRPGGISSPSLGRIFQSGICRGVKWIWNRCKENEIGPHMVVGWNATGDCFGDNYFCCPIGDLVEVLRRLSVDAPEFKRQLLKAVAPEGLVNDLAVDQQSVGPGFDEVSAVRI
jgi:hypothetical protein